LEPALLDPEADRPLEYQEAVGVWSMRVEERGQGGTLDGTPIVVDGVMYVTTGTRNVLAIDAKTGEVKWRYRPESEEGKTGANKGVVVADGKVVFGRRDNLLMALDQQTGHVVWQTRTTTQRAAFSSAAPVYYDERGCLFTPYWDKPAATPSFVDAVGRGPDDLIYFN